MLGLRIGPAPIRYWQKRIPDRVSRCVLGTDGNLRLALCRRASVGKRRQMDCRKSLAPPPVVPQSLYGNYGAVPILAARAKYRRRRDRFESNLTDVEWACLIPMHSPATSQIPESGSLNSFRTGSQDRFIPDRRPWQQTKNTYSNWTEAIRYRFAPDRSNFSSRTPPLIGRRKLRCRVSDRGSRSRARCGIDHGTAP